MNEATGGINIVYPIQLENVVVSPIVLWCTICREGISLFDKNNVYRDFYHQLYNGIIKHCQTRAHCGMCDNPNFKELYANASYFEKMLFKIHFGDICTSILQMLAQIANTLMLQRDKGRQQFIEEYVIEDTDFSEKKGNKEEVRNNGSRIVGWRSKKSNKESMYVRTYHEKVESLVDMCDLYLDPKLCLAIFCRFVALMKAGYDRSAPHYVEGTGNGTYQQVVRLFFFIVQTSKCMYFFAPQVAVTKFDFVYIDDTSSEEEGNVDDGNNEKEEEENDDDHNHTMNDNNSEEHDKTQRFAIVNRVVARRHSN